MLLPSRSGSHSATSSSRESWDLNPDPLTALNPRCGSASAAAQGLEDGGWHRRTYRREHAVLILSPLEQRPAALCKGSPRSSVNPTTARQ